MELKDLALLDCAQKPKFVNAFSKHGSTIFATKHTCTFWRGFDASKTKYFHITDSTRKRLANVPIDNITGSKLIDLKDKPACGVVFFSDGLHFLYLIRNNGVYIKTSSLRARKKVDDILFYTSQLMSGFIYYDFFSDTETLYINNVMDTLKKPDHGLLQDPATRKLLKAIQKELAAGKMDMVNKQTDDCNKKIADTNLCLQAFMFIHYAKIIDTTRISQEKTATTLTERLKNKTAATVNIIRVDTLYDETLQVINPFSVTGHYRNQPVGVGRKETKMIYIDGFMKTGYTRLATKEKINM